MAPELNKEGGVGGEYKRCHEMHEMRMEWKHVKGVKHVINVKGCEDRFYHGNSIQPSWAKEVTGLTEPHVYCSIS